MSLDGITCLIREAGYHGCDERILRLVAPRMDATFWQSIPLDPFEILLGLAEYAGAAYHRERSHVAVLRAELGPYRVAEEKRWQKDEERRARGRERDRLAKAELPKPPKPPKKAPAPVQEPDEEPPTPAEVIELQRWKGIAWEFAHARTILGRDRFLGLEEYEGLDPKLDEHGLERSELVEIFAARSFTLPLRGKRWKRPTGGFRR